MKKAITVYVSDLILAAGLVRTHAMFEKQCAKFEIKVTKGMGLAYESGFIAALALLEIPAESVMKIPEIADKLRENPEETCDCPNCK